MKFHFYIYFLFLKLCHSVDRIWLIRHCDKPKTNANPCCSELGYERAKNWHRYFKMQMHKNSIVKIYSSNFNEKKVCINNILYKPDFTCQKSQRMFLTAYYLQNTLQKFINFQENINTNYCVGEKNNLISDIVKNIKFSDAVVVWEHKEIIHIIRDFGINIKKWKNKFQNYYSIVFMIDIKTKQLFYDCFDFIKNMTSCPDEINKWLYNFEKIDDNNKNDNNKELTLYNNSFNKSNINYIVLLFFIFVLIVLLLTYVIISTFNLILLNRRRREYNIIL